MRVRSTRVLVAIAAMLLLAPSAGALTIKRLKSPVNGRIYVAPAAEEVTTASGGGDIGPGKTARTNLVVLNQTRSALEFDLAVAEVVGADAESQVAIRHGSRGGAAAWVTLERSSLRLRSGDTATLAVTIDIPKNVKPGSKPFAISVTQRTKPGATASSGAQPIFRQIAIYIVQLPGDAPTKASLKHLGVSADDTRLDTKVVPFVFGSARLRASAELRNEGERLLNPEASVRLIDVFGRTLRHYKSTFDTAYPRGSSSLVVPLKNAPSMGIFKVEMTTAIEAGERKRTLGWVIMIPWWLAASVAAALLGIAAQAVRWRRSRGNSSSTDDEAAPPEGDAGKWADDDLLYDEDDDLVDSPP